MSVLKNGSQTGKQVLDRRSHLSHSNNVNDSLHRAQYRTEHFRILFTQLLVKNDSKTAHVAFFTAVTHYDSYPLDQVSCLLSISGRLIVESPLNGTANLRNVWLHSYSKAVYNCSEGIQDSLSVL